MFLEVWKLSDRFNFVKRFFWRSFYDFFSWKYNHIDLPFLNYGYEFIDNSLINSLKLEKDDFDNRLFIQLYYQAIQTLDLKGKTVLEVGSGRGGGSAFISKYLEPKKMVGLELSKYAVNLCQKKFLFPNLEYMQGIAENLPFPDNTFDVVINIESSHCYQDMDKFVSEVIRVLKPQGFFSWTDHRHANNIENLDKQFSLPELKLIKHNIINDNVINAMNQLEQKKQKLLNDNAPRLFKKFFAEFSSMKDTRVYDLFKTKSCLYMSRLYQVVKNN